jgi:hypothetical protein
MHSLIRHLLRKGWLTMTILLFATPHCPREFTRTYRDPTPSSAQLRAIAGSGVLGAFGELPWSFEAN